MIRFARARRTRRACPACKGEKGGRERSDTGRTSPGLHTHGRRPNKAHDHATGTGFSRDRSTTWAVLSRMVAIGAVEMTVERPRRKK